MVDLVRVMGHMVVVAVLLVVMGVATMPALVAAMEGGVAPSMGVEVGMVVQEVADIILMQGRVRRSFKEEFLGL